MFTRSSAIAIASLLAATTASAQEVETPALAQAMLEAAEKTGDAAQVDAVANAVLEVFPDYAEAIEAKRAAIVASLAPPEVIEEAAAPEEEPSDPRGTLGFGKWTGTLGAGAAQASGNSENLTIGFALDARREHGIFAHNIEAGIDIASSNPDPSDPLSDSDLTQKRWYGAYQLDVAFSDRTYAYGRIDYEEDEFSGFDYRIFGGAGLGHYLYKSAPLTWKIEGGPGYRYSPIDDTRETESEVALYASTEVDWLIAENILFEQNVNAIWTSPTTTVESLTAITTKLTDVLSTSISYQVRYETDPPPGNDDVDTLLKASVNYGF